MRLAPLRIALELTGLELDAGGSARAIAALRAELGIREDLELVELRHRGRPGTGIRRVVRGLNRELVYMPLQLSRRAERAGADLLHCPVGVAPARSRVPLAVTVNDVMALDHPEWFTRANVLQQRLVLPLALRRAARVIVPSSHTRERLMETGVVEPANVDVVPYGVGPPFEPGDDSDSVPGELGIDGPYILTVGTLQPRKNLAAALAAFERVAVEGGPQTLVVAGARGWRDEEVLAALREPRLRKRVRLLGRVDDHGLVKLYRGADCLLFPSLYEGFGFPVLEAMACGTPVVCSDRTSLPEVAGGAAILANPEDPDALAAGLADVLGSPKRSEELAEAGLARAKEFSWQRCADLTVASYRRAAEG